MNRLTPFTGALEQVGETHDVDRSIERRLIHGHANMIWRHGG
jgi:hypothetical protein